MAQRTAKKQGAATITEAADTSSATVSSLEAREATRLFNEALAATDEPSGVELFLASHASLAREWSTPEEDEAWQDL